MTDARSYNRGALIAFEGLDKAGKSTQCAQLARMLSERGHRVKTLRFPDRTTLIGQMIDRYLKGETNIEDHVIHLLFSANRWEAAESIEADVTAGMTVLIDRYYYSGIVYSAAKANPLLGLKWARKPDEGLPRPDVCIFLSISPIDAAKRGGFGEEKYEKHEMQARVRALFQELQDGPDGGDFCVVDGGGTYENVQAAVVQIAEEVITRVTARRVPLRKIEPWST